MQARSSHGREPISLLLPGGGPLGVSRANEAGQLVLVLEKARASHAA